MKQIGYFVLKALGPSGGSVTDMTATLGFQFVALVLALLVILVFILQNQQSVEVSFLMFSGHLPLAIALLFAMILGALIVFAFGAARLLQLRIVAGRARRNAVSPGSPTS